ncbi:MAG: hypothetical protein LAQ69_18500 [Acidobacteriia bacterium]|nr:hypothetical protein [Terriglobia bacterium]
METRIDIDKPLYQPGQTLHMRFLCRDHAHRAAVDRPLAVSISDPQNAQAFTASLNTDRFGVAATDWNIPPNQRLGEYRIQAGDSNLLVKVSRYELPSFTVTAVADRAYYLPGQDATVEVRAQYLFGKPVPAAAVRIGRENNRRETGEGQTDVSGVLRANLDLRALHKELRSSDNRYRDTT